MEFIEKIDKMIAEAQFEMEKCLKLKSNKQRHVEYVSDRINNHIKEVAKNYPDDPTRSLADSLSKVPDFISDSFDYLDRVHLNALVAINAYQKVKDEYIAQQNEEAQLAEESPPEKKKATRKKTKRGVRDIGERPEDKLKNRRKKSKDEEES